jgi:hypothetical protein
VQAVVPAVVEHDRRAVAGNGYIEDHHAPHRLAILRGQRESRRPTPIVADDEKALLA